MPELVLFLDDGGVLSDNRLRGPQWQQLLGEFFPPLLGGTAKQWAEANRVAVAAAWTDESVEGLWQKAAADYAAFDRLYQVQWMASMCEYLGIPVPPAAACVDLAQRAAAYVRPRVRAAIPGSSEAVSCLHARGYRLHTASGESSGDLADYIGSMGVRSCFGRLYGPDLVNMLKVGPEYYTRVFADAGVAPEKALVVDDRPAAVGWAMAAGARAILIDAKGTAGDGYLHLGSLAELPALLAGWE